MRRLRKLILMAQCSIKSRRGKWCDILGIVLTILIAMTTIAMIGVVALCGGYIIFGDVPRLERAVANYESKKYGQAFRTLSELADKGMARAQLYLGDCYANGNGTTKDIMTAVKWYRASANQNFIEAQYRMYECYRDGIGVERDTKNAMKWLGEVLDNFNVNEQCD